MLLFYRMQHRASTRTMPKQLYILLSFITESDITEIRHLNFVIISNCMNHDTIAVHLFQRKLILFLKHALSSFPVKITYFSDGAASQYKNRKNFVNLCCHKNDFGVSAEWHFSATSHGKGACDGLGGTVKRLATKASLQRPYEEQIITLFQLFQWASSNIPVSPLITLLWKSMRVRNKALRHDLKTVVQFPVLVVYIASYLNHEIPC